MSLKKREKPQSLSRLYFRLPGASESVRTADGLPRQASEDVLHAHLTAHGLRAFAAGTGKEVHIDHKVALTGFNADIGLHRARVENLLLHPL